MTGGGSQGKALRVEDDERRITRKVVKVNIPANCERGGG